MKVLLIVPTYKYTTQYPAVLSISDFPSGLAYIASSLKSAGHEVDGLNLNNIFGFDNAYSMLANKLTGALEKEYDLIGIGGLCVDYAFIRDAIELIRNETDTPIVLGGGIINNDYEFIFNQLKPDFAIIGEAEETILKLCEALKGGDLNKIENLGYWLGNVAVFNKQNHDYGNLDERVFPDFGVFSGNEMVDKYSMSTRVLYRYSREYPRPMVITTARSCPFKCTFCTHHLGKYRARSVENIMEEIKELYEHYNFNILIVQDELFAVNKKRMKEFCEALIEKKGEYGWDFDWMFQTHASARLNDESLRLARESGCYFFSYGLESASPEVIESMDKRTNIDDIITAIDLASKNNVGFGGNLIFGDPAETQKTLLESLDFWQQYCQASQVFLSDVRPYPGSKLFEHCLEKGIIKDKKEYYETIDTIPYNMTSMPDESYYVWTHFISRLEALWINVMTVDAYKFEDDEDYLDNIGTKTYRIHAVCPYCIHDITYRQSFPMDIVGKRSHIGTGCTNCNKKIRINLKERYYAG